MYELPIGTEVMVDVDVEVDVVDVVVVLLIVVVVVVDVVGSIQRSDGMVAGFQFSVAASQMDLVS